MQLHNLYPFPEERKTRRRVGRGAGSGLGCTSGKGHKGQNARAGGGVRPGFEGGQMPLQRRLPKHGFKNYPFKVTYGVVHVGDLIARFPEADTITVEMIYSNGLCKPTLPCKVLADGEVTKAVTIEAMCFSAAAAEKIAKAGGKALSLELGEIE